MTLIERIGRKCQPTPAGDELLGYAHQIDRLVGSATEAMARHGKGAMGRVRLGTGATACIYLLPAMLRELRRKFPTLEITVTTGNTTDFLKAIEENSIDVGLVTLPAAGRMLDVTLVLDDEFVLIAPQDMPLPAKVDPAWLAGRPVILFEPGGRTRSIADAWFSQAGVTLRPIMSLGSVEAIKELVGAGLGCAVLPGMAVAGHRAPSGVAVRSLNPSLKRTLAIVVRRDKKLHKGLVETIRALGKLSV